MDLNTEISKHEKDGLTIYGKSLEKLSKELTFTEMIYYILSEGKKKPKKEEIKILNILFNLSVEHGVEPVSTVSARVSKSTGNNFNNSLASGINAFGKLHGCAVEECANFLKSLENQNVEEFISKKLEKKEIIFGLGHKFYKTKDFRAETLFEEAKKSLKSTKYIELFEKVKRIVKKVKGKDLLINIDGAIACVILDLGFSPRVCNAFFLIPRTVGLSAHIIEETEQKKGVRRFGK